MRTSIRILIAALAALASMGCAQNGDVPSPASRADPGQAEDSAGSTNERVVKAAGEYWAKNPNDYAGLSRAIESAGGDTVRFSFPKAGLSNLTGEEAAAAVRDGLIGLESNGAAPEGSAKLADVPVNAFEVGASWYHVQDQDGEWWNFNGTWNYRDDFIGSGSPDNASGLVVEGTDEKCWHQDGDWFHAASYDGENHSDLGYRKDVTVQSSVWGVKDATSGFKLLTDHGTHTISFRRVDYGCDDAPKGKYYWEHNQGGKGGWSFSINLAIFSISYSDSGGLMARQKSSELVYRP